MSVNKKNVKKISDKARNAIREMVEAINQIKN